MPALSVCRHPEPLYACVVCLQTSWTTVCLRCLSADILNHCMPALSVCRHPEPLYACVVCLQTSWTTVCLCCLSADILNQCMPALSVSRHPEPLYACADQHLGAGGPGMVHHLPTEAHHHTQRYARCRTCHLHIDSLWLSVKAFEIIFKFWLNKRWKFMLPYNPQHHLC